jgi:glycosyl hydrolase family 16
MWRPASLGFLCLIAFVVGVSPATITARESALSVSESPGALFFPETDQWLDGEFRVYWERNGGLKQFGYPISPPMRGDNGKIVQWLERARFEHHEDLAQDDRVLLGLLGREVTRERAHEPAFGPVVEPGDGLWFAETGHTLRGSFRAYWQATGGLPVYGFPISEPFEERNPADGQTYTVQYFERNRFEYHPELAETSFAVQLGLLGRQLYTGSGWFLAFSDEFNGDSLDRARWRTDYGSGSNGERQQYVPDAFQVVDGLLHIRAERRNAGAYQYASGIIHTRDLFAQAYGRFEIRAKAPKGRGLWPAFWLMPADGGWPPEIDVFEVLAVDTTTVIMTNHYLDGSGKRAEVRGTYKGPDLSQGFHTFAAEWSPGRITWFVDGVERHHSTHGVPSQPMFILANLAVGGRWGGDPDTSTPFPSSFQIDYIRVYQQRSGR